MSVSELRVDGDAVRLTLEIPLSGGMLDCEEQIQQALNAVGMAATAQALKRFDTDGSPIQLQGKRWTSKGAEPKAYQTPYGEVEVVRHVYQPSTGGKTYCPLEREGRIVVVSTPKEEVFSRPVDGRLADMTDEEIMKGIDEEIAASRKESRTATKA